MERDELSENVCACKGIRTCLLCEENGRRPLATNKTNQTIYFFCSPCNKAWNDRTIPSNHPHHLGDSIDFPGIFLKDDFITETEETAIINKIDETDYVDSQSGRRKQDYGPKVNFKRKKIKCDVFSGLPAFSRDLYERMKPCSVLTDFVPVEQCHLEYLPERGSAIDPHFDDFWLWGERLVTVNLLSDTILCFTHPDKPDIEIHVPMNRRSLLVVYGPARYEWKHAIHREDIHSRRVAVTLRELSTEFKEGGSRSDDGERLVATALTFDGKAVGATC